MAEQKAIPNFIERLVSKLTAPTGQMPKLFRISLMQSGSSGTNLEDLAFADGVVNYLVQVYSFKMDSSAVDLDVSASGAFLPTSFVLWFV